MKNKIRQASIYAWQNDYTLDPGDQVGNCCGSSVHYRKARPDKNNYGIKIILNTSDMVEENTDKYVVDKVVTPDGTFFVSCLKAVKNAG